LPIKANNSAETAEIVSIITPLLADAQNSVAADQPPVLARALHQQTNTTMKLIDANGIAVNDTDIAQHKFLLVIIETSDKKQSLMTAQPDAGWAVVDGHTCLDYTDALEWAMHASFGSAAIGTRGVWNIRIGAAAITRAVANALGHMAPITKAVSKGRWLANLRKGAELTDAANRTAITIGAADIVDLPAPGEIEETNADGQPVPAAQPGGQPPRDPTGWKAGPKFVKLINTSDVWERGTRHMGRLGSLWAAVAAPVDSAYQTKEGPLGGAGH
jgi:hypothetical protein